MRFWRGKIECEHKDSLEKLSANTHSTKLKRRDSSDLYTGSPFQLKQNWKPQTQVKTEAEVRRYRSSKQSYNFCKTSGFFSSIRVGSSLNKETWVAFWSKDIPKNTKNKRFYVCVSYKHTLRSDRDCCLPVAKRTWFRIWNAGRSKGLPQRTFLEHFFPFHRLNAVNRKIDLWKRSVRIVFRGSSFLLSDRARCSWTKFFKELLRISFSK